MRRRVIAWIALMLCCYAMSVQAAHAEEDAIDVAINTLKRTNVYVAPGTDGTTSTSLSELKQVLQEGDHIVVVMVPKQGTTYAQSDAANKILASLKEPSILVLAYDRSVDAYSNKLPDTVTVDLIGRAKSIARTPVEITSVFVREVHKYQSAHPDPTPSASEVPTPPSSPQGEGGSFWWLLWSVLAGLAVGAFFYFRTKPRPTLVIRYSPRAVNDELQDIKRLIDPVADPEMTNSMRDIIKDTEAFFKRAKGVSPDDVRGFAKRLHTAVELLRKYIEIQEEPRYAPNPPGADALLHSGLIAMKGLSSSILKAVREENAGAVLDFQMKADLLSADIRRDYQ